MESVGIDPRTASKLIYAETTGTAGATTCTLTVPDGCIDRVIWCVAYHDHAGALTGRWIYYDDSGAGHEMCTDYSIAQSARFNLYGANGCPMPAPLIMRDGQRLQISITGIGGAEHCYILSLIERQYGTPQNA